MSTYHDIHSHILYGHYGSGRRTRHSTYAVGMHGGNSDPRYWDYRYEPKFLQHPYLPYYGGRRRVHGCGFYSAVNSTISPNTWYGRGRRRRNPRVYRTHRKRYHRRR